jgi:hypothetical protein
MAFLFGRGKKSPSELAKSTKQLLVTFQTGGSPNDADPKVRFRPDLFLISLISRCQASEKVSQNMSAMKIMLYGDGDHEAKSEQIDKLGKCVFRQPL